MHSLLPFHDIDVELIPLLPAVHSHDNDSNLNIAVPDITLKS